ncbi:MAG: hypothetical protein ACUVSS_05455 [Anaerolineae bacterium]
MSAVKLDVVALVPEGWGLCQACEVMMARADLDQAPPARGLDELPPEWQADFQRLSGLIFDLAERYDDRLVIRVYDPRSLQGMAKALRYWARRYPTFVVDGRAKISGWDVGALEQAIASRFAEAEQATPSVAKQVI